MTMCVSDYVSALVFFYFKVDTYISVSICTFFIQRANPVVDLLQRRKVRQNQLLLTLIDLRMISLEERILAPCRCNLNGSSSSTRSCPSVNSVAPNVLCKISYTGNHINMPHHQTRVWADALGCSDHLILILI